MRASETQLQHHMAAAPKIVSDLVKPIVDGGGKNSEVLTVLETVILGTLTTLARLDGQQTCRRYVEAMMTVIAEQVVERAHKIDLIDGPPAGSA